MRRTIILGMIIALGVPLAACGTRNWAKAGANRGVMRADLADCRAKAGTLVAHDANIESDILATRGQDWERTGTLSTKKANFAAADQEREQDYIGDCMKAKGYLPAS